MRFARKLSALLFVAAAPLIGCTASTGDIDEEAAGTSESAITRTCQSRVSAEYTTGGRKYRFDGNWGSRRTKDRGSEATALSHACRDSMNHFYEKYVPSNVDEPTIREAFNNRMGWEVVGGICKKEGRGTEFELFNVWIEDSRDSRRSTDHLSAALKLEASRWKLSLAGIVRFALRGAWTGEPEDFFLSGYIPWIYDKPSGPYYYFRCTNDSGGWERKSLEWAVQGIIDGRLSSPPAPARPPF